MLFSLVIVFPLHFATQAAFRRREKALEYFSMFKAGAMALVHSFRIAEDLADERKAEIKKIIADFACQLFFQLENRVPQYDRFQEKVNPVMKFIETNRKEISNRNVLRIIRYLRDVSESSVYLISLVRHRTMAGIRFYQIFFICLFPLLQAPMLLHRLDAVVPVWSLHVIIGFTTLFLVTLSNFQTNIEYPFDQRGIDNIWLNDFNLDRNETDTNTN